MSQKILRLKHVQAMTGLCRSSIYNRLNRHAASYDPTFPQPFKLSACPGTRGGAIGFLESEVLAWIDARVQASRGGVPSPATSLSTAVDETGLVSAVTKREVRRV